MRPEEDIEAEKNDERLLDQIAKKGRAGADFVSSIRAARGACEQAGLDATFNADGTPEFSSLQTAKAVRYAREDASAALMLQFHVMRRLDRNRNYMWAIIVILLLIAGQMKG